MDCLKFKELYPLYLEGRYSEIPALDEFEWHFSSCEKCFEAFVDDFAFSKAVQYGRANGMKPSPAIQKSLDLAHELMDKGLRGDELVKAFEERDIPAKVSSSDPELVRLLDEVKQIDVSKDIGKALNCIIEIEKLDPGNIETLSIKEKVIEDLIELSHGAMHIYPADHEFAAALTRNLIWLYPNFFPASVWFASASQRIGKIKECRAVLDHIWKKGLEWYDDLDPILMHILGRIYRLDFGDRPDDKERSYFYLEKSFELDPGNVWPLANLAWYYFCDGKYGDSFKVINKAFELDLPADDHRYIVDYIVDYCEIASNNKWLEAYPYLIQMLELAIMRFPYEPNVLYNLVYLHTKTGHYQTALEYFKKLESFDYKDFNAYLLASEIYCIFKDKEKAEKYRKLAILGSGDKMDLVKRILERRFEEAFESDSKDEVGIDIPDWMIRKRTNKLYFVNIDEDGKDISEFKLN